MEKCIPICHGGKPFAQLGKNLSLYIAIIDNFYSGGNFVAIILPWYHDMANKLSPLRKKKLFCPGENFPPYG